MKAVFSLLIALLLALNPAWSQEPGPNAPLVTISTSEGNITLRLFPDKSPLTVANFLSYVDSGHYDGTIFHDSGRGLSARHDGKGDRRADCQ